MFTKIKNLLLYGGLRKEEFKDISPLVDKDNTEGVCVYSIIAISLFAILTIVSTFRISNSEFNRSIYIVCLCVSILVKVLVGYSDNKTINCVLVYIFQLTLYGFSLLLVFKHTDIPSVTAMVLLVVIPLLFTNRPVVVILSTLIFEIVFAETVIHLKSSKLAMMDIGNATAFGLVAIFCGIFVCRLRIHNLMQNRKIELLSQTDLLTGLLNRNSYEENLELYPARVNKNICCIYGDVNGLHEVNNTQGHGAGDAMLQYIAKEFQKQFGIAESYRIGGDEYISFALDEKEEDVLEKINFIEKMCEKVGYHVSIGHFNVKKEDLDMHEIIKKAEQEMYQKKFEYYRDCKNDRRRRN